MVAGAYLRSVEPVSLSLLLHWLLVHHHVWRLAEKFSTFWFRPSLLPDGTAKRPTNRHA
jgi:hypothetical protein